MVRYAADLLVEPALEYGLTNFILRQISVLDDLGAWEWNLRWASLLWVVIFAGIRIFLGERGGVIWYALIHAILTGVGGTVCAYLSFVSAEHMTGTPEPLGTVLCYGPLTSLHRVLPTAAVGYSIFDLIDGFRLGADFLSHGAAMFAFSLYMMETNKSEILAVMLALEISTVHLNLLRAEFFNQNAVMVNMLAFVLTFFLSRLVYGPFSMFKHSYLLYTIGRTDERSQECLPPGFDHVILITSIFFTVLNTFWFYKILKKLKRKLKGKEGVQESNHLGSAREGNANISSSATNRNNSRTVGDGAQARKVKFKKEQD